MKINIIVHRTEEVEVPEIPAAVAAIVERHGARLDLDLSYQEYDSGALYCEAFCNLHTLGLDCDVDEDALRAELAGCPEWDEETMNGGKPLFQSDAHDAFAPLTRWGNAQQDRSPNAVRFTAYGLEE